MSGNSHPVICLLRHREVFWNTTRQGGLSWRQLAELLVFIVFSSALYGAILAGWRSLWLAAYVAVKLPMLLLGTTSLVALLNWITAALCGSGLSFRQISSVTYGAIGVACWILLGLAPITAFFTFAVASYQGTPAELRLTHNYLLLTHIGLIAVAGVAGNVALWRGLKRVVRADCAVWQLYGCWLAAFTFVGCELSWMLRPFIGSPFYPVVFLRPDALQRNFYEFVFGEVIPFVLKGGS